MSRSPFRSFWQAGYECADHINRSGDRVDLLAVTGHDLLVREDYRALAPFGITTVREGIRWGYVERRPGVYDWGEVVNRIRAGQEAGIQQLWDICHFGFPDDLSPTHPRFAQRLANVAREFARLWRSLSDEPLIVTPINEMSFLSWHAGDVQGTVPFVSGMGGEIKVRLVQAAIAAIEAIWEVDPQARILHTEPLIDIVPPRDQPGLVEHAQFWASFQFEALDLLAGYRQPELGGNPRYLDLVGCNYYYDNQWELPLQPLAPGEKNVWLEWEEPHDSRRAPLSELLARVARRYNRPLVISETSHIGIGRGAWITMIAQECATALANGVDLLGVCLYPIIDRPDWDDLDQYHNSGLWDLACTTTDPFGRLLSEPYAAALLTAQHRLKHQQRGVMI